MSMEAAIEYALSEEEPSTITSSLRPLSNSQRPCLSIQPGSHLGR